MSFVVKEYDKDLISIYNDVSMSYFCICDDTEENRHLLDDMIIECNQLYDEVKHYEKKCGELESYLGKDRYDLMLENIKLKNMIKYQKGLYDLEKNYFSEVLVSFIEEYPESMVLRDFRCVVGL